MNIDPRQSRETPNPLIQELLHAIAQPLTSLQVCVLLRDLPPLDRDRSTNLVGDMADQVTLLSRLFETLRQVLNAETDPPRINEDALKLLLPSLLTHWRKSALERNVTLLLDGSPVEPCCSAGLRGGALETILQEVFAAALESTPSQGSISVALFRQSDDASCQLRLLGGSLLSPASFPGRFSLPTAKTLLDSEQQHFTYTLNPFAATLDFPSSAQLPWGASSIADPRAASGGEAE